MPYAYLNGFKMHYEIAGKGTPLLLLHGLGSSSKDWLLQTPIFSMAYRVIAPDCRGHGDSDKPRGRYSVKQFAKDTTDLLDCLGLDRAHVLGLSMGGLVAQHLALDTPQRVGSLVLANTFSQLIVTNIRALFATLRRALVLNFLSMERIGQLVGRQLFPEPDQEALRQLTVQRWAHNDKAAYRAASLACLRFNVTQRLGEIHCPTLIIAGDRDRTISPAHREILHRGIAGSRLIVISDSTHATPIDQPQVFNQTVLEFLASMPD